MARRTHLIIVAGLLAVLLGAPASALAAAGDPDPAFGTGGVALVPGTDRLNGQGAPLVQAGGKVVAASLLPGDVVFLSRFTAAGQPDPSFGTGSGSALTKGTTTGIKAPLKRAATALGPKDTILVAGGSKSGGSITVGRFTAAGALDKTFNKTGKAVIALKGRKAMLPTAMLVRSDGSVLITVLGDVGGKYGLTVVRLTPAGKLDTTWGAGKGWVQALIGTKPAAAFDLAELSDGSLVLAGGVLDGAYANPTDTAVAKIGPQGAVVWTTTQDLSAARSADGAFGVAALPTGGFFVTGLSGSQGMVARFTSTGALDGAFGTGGAVYSGLVPAGARFVPVDVQLDGAGRPVVAGTVFNVGGILTATRWGVVRLQAAGTTVDFTSMPQQCSNAKGKGPSGITVAGNTLLVAGSCNDKGTSAVMALAGGSFSPAITAANVGSAEQPAGYETIRLANLDPTALLTAAQSLQASPFRYGPFRYGPFRYGPFRYGTFDAAPFRYGAVRTQILDQLLLTEVPLRDGRSWSDVLPARLRDLPLQSLTLGQVLDLPELGTLTLGDLDFAQTPLADLSLAALLLYPLPANRFPAPTDAGWGADGAKTFLDLELEGRDLSDYYRQNLKLGGIDFSPNPALAAAGRPLIARIPIGEIDLAKTPLEDFPVGGAADLGELLQGLVPGRDPNPTLGELLLAFVDANDIAFETAPRAQLLRAADLRQTRLLRYRVEFSVDCPSGAHVLRVQLPGDARYVPGSSSLGEPTGTGPYDFDLCRGAGPGVRTGALTFDAEPGSSLGEAGRGSVALLGTDLSKPLVATVTDDDADGATLQPGVLRTGHISSPGDEDTFTIPAPAPGTQVTVTLSQLTADLDLQVTGPAIDDAGDPSATPFRYGALQSSPFRYGPVGDPTGDPGDPSVVSPNAVQDAPFRYGGDQRGISVKRGTEDESVSLIARGTDASGAYTVHVAGFDEASSPQPYVVRVLETVAPPAPACVSRTGLPTTAQGTLPDGLPGDTRTLVLVNEARLHALYDADDPGAVDAMLREVRGRYLDRPEVRGRLVDVGASPGVAAAYRDWDASPCAVSGANGVVRAVNDLVDSYRSGGRLPELRNVVLLGADVALPQMRVADESRIANESTYADELVFGGKDDPVSRALRLGYAFTDDAYGDFDPQSLGSRALYVPDVAIGRLVETPAEIRTAVEAYLDNDGVIQRDTGFVAGYDFLSDAADSIFQGLEPLRFARTTTDFSGAWDALFGTQGLQVQSGISSVNAHYDVHRALPAKDFFSGGAGLIDAANVTASPRTLLFTIGCHSGLNVAAKGLAGNPVGDPRVGDWVQTVAGSGALWVGQTGYGLGDSLAIAYSEKLMSSFARLIGEQHSSLGQSLMFAKQDYAATALGLFDDYDVKALQEATFYGLPTYVTEGGQTAPPVQPAGTPRSLQRAARQARAQADADAVGDAVAQRFAFDADDHPYEREDDTTSDERGTYWKVAGNDPLVISRRPIQPRWSTDVTAADGLPVHGALVDALEMDEQADIDPVIARPTIDLAEHEPEPDVESAPFPATLAAVAPVLEPDGRHDRLTLYTGQFRPNEQPPLGAGTQRLYTRMVGRTLRSASEDYTPPQIRSTDTGFSADTVVFRVETRGGEFGGGVGGVVLYRLRSTGDAWHSVQLVRAGGDLLQAGAALGSPDDEVVEWTAQVADAAGNVGVSTNKVFGYAAKPTPPPSGGPAVTLDGPQQGVAQAFDGSPTIGLESSGPATYEHRVDGGPWTPYTGPFQVDGISDGTHTVAFRGSDGSTAERSFLVDTAAPTITATPRSLPGPGGWYAGDVTVDFLCSDAGAGFADGACPAAVTLTEDGPNSVTRSVTDRAGRSSGDVEFGPYRIDRTAPDQPEIDQFRESGTELRGDEPLSGSAFDGQSGIELVRVRFTEQQGDEESEDPGKDRVVTRTSPCEAGEGGGCTWAVPRPPDGFWATTVTAVDRAGNETPVFLDVSSSADCFDCSGGESFTYDGFDSTEGLRLNGAAKAVPVDGPAELELTPASGGVGSAFRAQPVDLRNSFSVRAHFRLDEGSDSEGAAGADGIALVLQHDPEVATGLGGGGGLLGYDDLRPSVAVEFDTYPNEWDDWETVPGVALTRDGAKDELASAFADLFGGDRWTWVYYDAQRGHLDVYVSDTNEQPTAPLISEDVDLQGEVGRDTAFIGWTGSTGESRSRQRILDWAYASRGPEGPPNLLVNGSFERPDIATGTAENVGGAIPGWTLGAGSTGSGIELQDRFAGAEPDADRGGHQWTELDSDGNVELRQQVDLDPGQSYQLEFLYSRPPGSSEANDDWFLRIADANDENVGYWQWFPTPGEGQAPAYTEWNRMYFPFDVPFDGPFTGPYTIVLRGSGPDDGVGPLIDDVRLVPTFGCSESCR